MATDTIQIELDAEVARAYIAASLKEQKKIQELLNVWLRTLLTPRPVAFRTLMDEISERAQARGLTPEILESLLHE